MAPKRQKGNPSGGVSTRRTTRSSPQDVEESVHNTQKTVEASEPHPLEPAMQRAITADVLQILRDVMPHIIEEAAEAVATRLEKSDNTRKRKTKEFEDDEESSEDEKRNGPTSKGCDYKFFKSCNPPPFNGKGTAADAQQWIREMEATIRISNCKENTKVLFASHSFTSEALCWWDNMKDALGDKKVKKLKWSKFKKMVIERFCSEIELDKIEREFLTLEAGEMTHQEYTTKFNEMARLCPELVSTEKKRIKRYVYGLPQEIRKIVKVCDPVTYNSAVNLSATLFTENKKPTPAVKKESDKKGKENEEAKKVENKSGNWRKRTQEGELKECTKCKRKHRDECRYKDIPCFRCTSKDHVHWYCPQIKCNACGEKGHKANNCPKEKEGMVTIPEAKGRAYYIGTRE